MTNVRMRKFGAMTIATVTLLGAAACGGGSDEPKSKSTATASATPSESAAPASAGQPEWANPVTKPGTKIASVKAKDVTVDVYQVGTTKATKHGQFVDPDTNKPIIAEGADIVFVNYVVTNNGAPLDLGFSLVDVSPRYEDWKYMQGMDSVVDRDLYAAQKVNTDVLAQGAFKDPGVYTFAKGESVSVGENFLYQKGSKVDFKVTYTPVDAKGDLLHDKRIEAKGKGTIK